jgi:uncharacterized membrane protein HdeD (DUF308 family)
MTVLSIILGVILMIGGVACIFTPFATFLVAGYFIGIMLFIFGIIGLIKAIRDKGGALQYVTSILAIVVGIIALVRPGSTLVIDTIILILVAIWFIVQGITSIVVAIQNKRQHSSWVALLIIGILALVIAVICFINPMVEVFAIGILIGFFLIQIGLDMIAMAGMNKGNGTRAA